MSEEVKRELITCCNNISNEEKILSKVKQDLLTASDLCKIDTISINNMNMKESISSLSTDIDKISVEIKKYIEDINNEIIIMNKVV